MKCKKCQSPAVRWSHYCDRCRKEMLAELERKHLKPAVLCTNSQCNNEATVQLVVRFSHLEAPTVHRVCDECAAKGKKALLEVNDITNKKVVLGVEVFNLA